MYKPIYNRFVELLDVHKNRCEIPPEPAGATPSWALRCLFEMVLVSDYYVMLLLSTIMILIGFHRIVLTIGALCAPVSYRF